VDGTTVIAVHDGQVLIDVTDGSIKKIEFRQAATTAPEQHSGWWHGVSAQWNSGWSPSIYKPFMLSKWAYDDSTIDKWYGLGFVWFLIRLALALLLAIADIILSLIFLLAQLAYLFFGPTGRNIVWGAAILLFLLIVVTVYVSAR
jgi:hypothetical protein